VVGPDTTSELALKLYFDQMISSVEFNYTMGVYESNNLKFYDMCNSYNYVPAEVINE
jgi:hypothetical protein